MHLTEASCDACPAKCRLEMFTTRERPWVDALCVAGRVDRKWTGADAIPADTPEVVRNAFGAPTTGRRLLACTVCSAPCILETEAATVSRCPVGNIRVAWFPAK